MTEHKGTRYKEPVRLHHTIRVIYESPDGRARGKWVDGRYLRRNQSMRDSATEMMRQVTIGK
jgi:hypothetical protein